MKKPVMLFAIVLCTSQWMFAQNTFPTTGAAGIGTTSPSAMLTIVPSSAAALEVRQVAGSTTATGEFRMVELTANGSQYVGFKAPSSIATNQIWILPNTAGTSGQVLAKGTGSDLTWSTVPSLSLNNLGTTAINADLVPGTTATRNLGSSTARWNLGYFSGGVAVGNTTTAAAGMIRYNAGVFQGYNGTSWVSLSGGTSGANTSLSNLTTTAINASLNPAGVYALGGSSLEWESVWSKKMLFGNLNVAVLDTASKTFGAGGARLGATTANRYNVNIGWQAGASTGTGTNFENVTIGAFTGQFLTNGYANVAIGTRAGTSLSIGGGNTLVGQNAGTNTTAGLDNTAVGVNAGISLTSGNNNAFFGKAAGTNITSGNDNVCVGVGTTSGTTAYAAAGVTLVGANSKTTGSFNNATAIGNGAEVAASNRVRLGNNLVDRISGFVGFSIDSDRRLKQNVRDYELGLDFINKLRPVSYEYITNPSAGNRQGFIAQEVEAVLGAVPFEGLCKPAHEADYYALNYSAFVVPLVNAVKELSAQNDALQSEIASLKSQLKQVDESLMTCCMSHLSVASGSNSLDAPAHLEQNAPNPFSHDTAIRYYIPQTASKANIAIYAMDGNEIQHFALAGKGAGFVSINGSTLTPGVYVYTLVVDGKVIDSKQMILTRN